MVNISSALIIKDKKILLNLRAKGVEKFPSYWGFPGGKNDDGETPEEAVVREVKEEIGLDFKVSSLFLTSKGASGKVYSYLGSESGEVKLQKEEVDEISFFSYSGAIGLNLAFSYTTEVLNELKEKNLIE
jgi:8-oxo-dGTP pyrophosphatase MutT (NUDIX family)